VYTKPIQESPSGPSEDTFSGPAVDNETALRDGCTGAVYTKPIQETLFLVLTCCLRNQKQSLTPNEETPNEETPNEERASEMSVLSRKPSPGTGPTRGGVRRRVAFFLTPPQRRQPGPQLGDLDFQGGDLLARSLGSDPPLLAAPGQVGKAVLVAFDGGLEFFVLAFPPISVCTD